MKKLIRNILMSSLVGAGIFTSVAANTQLNTSNFANKAQSPPGTNQKGNAKLDTTLNSNVYEPSKEDLKQLNMSREELYAQGGKAGYAGEDDRMAPDTAPTNH